MGERQRILDLLDRAYKKEAWHGPALLETLKGVNAPLAAKRPPHGAHSIWELVEHVASWNELVAKRLEGKKITYTPEYNFPPVPKNPSPAAWKKSLARLARTQAHFRREVARFPVAKLGRLRPSPPQQKPQSWNVLIHGQIQHGLYHAGQIAMLRRMFGKPIA